MADKLKIEHISVEKLIPYARNARTHSPEQVAQIAASIKEFGFNNPVLIDQSSGIIAGHGRVMAARKLDMKDVPCVRLAHLTENQKRAYILADNKLALGSGWDEEMLKLELEALSDANIDVSAFGFETAKIDIPMVTDEFAEKSNSAGKNPGASYSVAVYDYVVSDKDDKRYEIAKAATEKIRKMSQTDQNIIQEKLLKIISGAMSEILS